MLQQIQASKYRRSCLGFLLHLWTSQTCASTTCASLANSDKSSGLRHKIQAPSESFFSFWIFSTVQWEMIGKSFPGKPSSLYFLKRVRIKPLHFEAVWQNKTKKKVLIYLYWFFWDFQTTAPQSFTSSWVVYNGQSVLHSFLSPSSFICLLHFPTTPLSPTHPSFCSTSLGYCCPIMTCLNWVLFNNLLCIMWSFVKFLYEAQ